MESTELPITIKFAGGAELLFNNIKTQQINLPPIKKCYPDSKNNVWTIKYLLSWMKDNLLKERPEMFMQEDSVRPGILVLINDTDWELLGQLEYEIQAQDAILFMSTLHGG